MNQTTVLALVAIVATVGIIIAATTIAAPALARETDTRSNPLKTVKERDTGDEAVKCLKLPDGSTECP
jgi:hypothetical protein